MTGQVSRRPTLLGGLIMLVLSGAATLESPARAAPATEEEPRVFRTFAKVEIGAGGEVLGVVAQPELGPDIGAAVERSVRTLSFSPATVNGKPVSGTTYVRLMGCAAPIDGGAYRMAFDYLSHGPASLRIVHPTYPPNALRAGVEGAFLVQVIVQPDGTAKLDQVTHSADSARTLKTFAPAIEGWVSALRYDPERVDGKGVPTTVQIPLEFNLGSIRRANRTIQNQDRQSDACQIAFGRERERKPESLALNSPFTVKPGG